MRLPVQFAVALTALSLAAGAQEVAAPAATPAPAKPAEVKLAQATTPSSRKAAPAATPAEATPEATPAPKKRNFLQRLFGKKELATPAPATPAPTPTPTPTPKPRPKLRKQEPSEPTAEQPTKTEETAPEAPAKPAPEPAATKAAAPTKGTKGAKAAAATEEKKEEKTPEQIALDKAVASGDETAIEKAKYDEVKSRAMKDEKIQALKAKADAAPTEEEGRKALRAYNKALFQKMRTLDGSLSDRIDRMENAVMKRL